MIVRRTFLFGFAASTLAFSVQAYASEPTPFTAQGFASAQKAGKSILVHITASWCPTCKAQRPILGELTATPAFKNLTVFNVDFDAQKDIVNAFRAQMQSTLIVFKAGAEVGRSVGDTNAASIKALLDKAV
ncbi:MAG: thioredoxin family protein [Roseiarcus sp.]|jgi:thiol-disulfide isomerase/thioredoxin